MSKVTPEQVIAFASTLQGKNLVTISRGRSFAVDVVDGRLVFTPSTNRPRVQTPHALAALCERFSTTGSFAASEYRSLTAHASYTLAVIQRLLSEPNRGKRNLRPSHTRTDSKKVAVKSDATSVEAHPARILDTLALLQRVARRSEDLLKREYRGSDQTQVLNGFCYVLVECMWRLFPGKFQPFRIGYDDGTSHWFLRDGAGSVFEAISTGGKRCMPVSAYEEGKRRALLTKAPSRRAIELMSRASLKFPVTADKDLV